MNRRVGHDDLETRIKDQFPALFITLVSVLIGLALADLVSEARVRMVFWPVNLHTLRTWFELSGNLLSAFYVSQAAIPHLRTKGGRLIFLSSGAARSGGKISAAYAASKAGMEGLMRYYAAYLREQRITANAIAPSLIDTAMVEQMNLGPTSELPLGRLGRVDEIWPIVRMIVETEYLTGQTIHVNAGRYMT